VRALAALLTVLPATMAPASALPGQALYPVKLAVEQLQVTAVSWLRSHGQVGAGAAQVPDHLLPEGGDVDGDQLVGAVQAGQPAAVAPVGLGPCRRPLGGMGDGAITWQATPWRCSSRVSS
jgi:hypothetical protein